MLCVLWSVLPGSVLAAASAWPACGSAAAASVAGCLPRAPQGTATPRMGAKTITQVLIKPCCWPQATHQGCRANSQLAAEGREALGDLCPEDG